MSPILFALAAVLVPATLIPFVAALPRAEARLLSATAMGLSAALSSSAAVAYLMDPSPSVLRVGAALFQVDALAATVGPAIAVVGLALVLAAPTSELRGRFLVGVQSMVAAGIGALLAGNVAGLLTFEVGSALTVILMLRGRRGGRLAARTLGASAATWIAVAMLDRDVAIAGWDQLAEVSRLHPVLLVALLLSVLGRLGVPPLATWASASLGSSTPLQALPGLLPLGGITLAARWLHPELSTGMGHGQHLALTSLLLLLTLVAAGLALIQQDALRALAFTLATVQGLVLVAVLDPEPLGHLGGELLWGASLVAGAGFSLSVLAANARIGPLRLDRFHGLDRGARWLGVTCLLFGLALAGLPGSVDFVAQELLLNAGISHSVTALVLASAVAACLGLQNLRVFFRLFYGPGPEVAGLGLRPRELLAIVPLAALLVVGGIAPGLVPLLRTAGAVAGG